MTSDALGQEINVGDTVVTHGFGRRHKDSNATRYSLAECLVTKLTPQGCRVKEITDETPVREKFRRNHEVVKINDAVIGDWEYGVGIDGVAVTEGLTREQAEQWVQRQEDFDIREKSEYYVIRRAHGTWVRL